jgi:hypothetical protein
MSVRVESCVDRERSENPMQDLRRTLVTWFIGNGIGTRGIGGTCVLHFLGKLLPYSCFTCSVQAAHIRM